MDCVFRGVGNESIVSRVMTSVRAALCTSTTGDSPETVTVSSIPPTDMDPLIVWVKFAGTSTPSATKVENPGRVIVTVYVPAVRPMMVYRPVPSVTATRLPSISNGLAASTVTPGSTPPVLSVTSPVICVWAKAAAGTKTTASATRNNFDSFILFFLLRGTHVAHPAHITKQEPFQKLPKTKYLFCTV